MEAFAGTWKEDEPAADEERKDKAEDRAELSDYLIRRLPNRWWAYVISFVVGFS